MQQGQDNDLTDTKSLAKLSIQFDPHFSLHLVQQNNTQNHGTTVWDSAKLLAFYLFETFKRPKFKVNEDGDEFKIKDQKRCLELGSGCGLGGLLMAALGFETVLTDLPEVVDLVLLPNYTKSISGIHAWWYYLQQHDRSKNVQKPKISVRSLDWLELALDTNKQVEEQVIGNCHHPFHYIIAADCIYEIELIEPLLKVIKHYSTSSTLTYIAMERRDDTVVDGFIQLAKIFGFEAKMVIKKNLKNFDLVQNEDVEIWKLKLKRNRMAK